MDHWYDSAGVCSVRPSKEQLSVPMLQSYPVSRGADVGAFGCADMLSIPIGKAIMKNREPMKLKRFAAVHNAFLFGLSLYMCLECIQQVRHISQSTPELRQSVTLCVRQLGNFELRIETNPT